MTIRKKLLSSCILLSLGLVISTFLSFFMVSENLAFLHKAHTEGITISQATTDIRFSVVQVQQWLTDISVTRAASGLDDGYTEAEKHAVLIRKNIGILKDKEPTKEKEFDVFLKKFELYYIHGKKMANSYIKYGTDAGNKSMRTFDQYADSLAEEAKLINSWSEDKFNQELEQSERLFLRTKIFQAVINLLELQAFEWS